MICTRGAAIASDLLDMRFLAIGVMAASFPAWGGEFAIFSSGARMQVDRHEFVQGSVRLYQGSGMTEVPAALIVEFEVFEDVPAPLSASAPIEPEGPVAEVAPSADPKDLIREAAEQAGLPPEFVASVARVESGFQPKAVSPKGAIGVMQLMPSTAKALGADPTDVRQNIYAGTRLLRDLLLKYDGDVVKALAAYNAGSGAVARYQGLPPFDETRRYVNKVINAYQKATAEE